MLNIDRSAVNAENRGLPLPAKLEEIVTLVSYAKPLCEFYINDDCVRTKYDYTKDPVERTKGIYRVEVFEEGEKLGALGIFERHTGSAKEEVYGVESFRIHKHRGQGNMTQTKDIKVAMRNAKKAFVSRANDELRELISSKVKEQLHRLTDTAKSYVVYSFDTSDEILNLAMLSYQARLAGKATFEMSSTPLSVKNTKDHELRCEAFTNFKFLNEQRMSKLGYGLHAYSNGSVAVLRYADDSVKKYKDFDSLPIHLQNKFGMFKVINEGEPHTHLGCKLEGDMYYIVADDILGLTDPLIG